MTYGIKRRWIRWIPSSYSASQVYLKVELGETDSSPNTPETLVKGQAVVSLAVAKERGDPAPVGSRGGAGRRTRGTLTAPRMLAPLCLTPAPPAGPGAAPCDSEHALGTGLRQPEQPRPCGPRRAGRGWRPGETWRAAGRRGRSVGSWCAGEWAPGVRGPGRRGREPACSATQGRAGRGKEQGRWPKVSSGTEIAGPGLQRGSGLPGHSPRAGSLWLSREIGAGTWDPVPGVRFWRDSILLPQAHGQGFPSFLFPHTSLFYLCIGGPLSTSIPSATQGRATDLSLERAQPTALSSCVQGVALSYTGTPGDGHFGGGGHTKGSLGGEGRGPGVRRGYPYPHRSPA